jgi:hypothetical protein
LLYGAVPADGGKPEIKLDGAVLVGESLQTIALTLHQYWKFAPFQAMQSLLQSAKKGSLPTETARLQQR